MKLLLATWCEGIMVRCGEVLALGFGEAFQADRQPVEAAKASPEAEHGRFQGEIHVSGMDSGSFEYVRVVVKLLASLRQCGSLRISPLE